MKYIKLFRPYNGEQRSMAQIYCDHYCSSFEHISELANQLRKDFPFIKDKDIQVHVYGGKRIKGITFVEVMLLNGTKKPKDYKEIKEIEYIL